MPPQFTLVSGYINIESIETHLGTSENIHQRDQIFPLYKERGQKLINIPIQKVIFIDARYIDQFQGNDLTQIIPITLEEMDIYPYYKQILLQNQSGCIEILSPNPKKDTALFHLIQIAKTEFIKKAIQNDTNQNDTNQNNDIYAWIDFGISKIFNNDKEFEQSIMNISQILDKIKPNTIKIPGCWQLNPADINNDFTRVNWYFCGGFFIGYKNTLLEFEKQIKKELKFILDNEKKLTFEVNIWFRLWRKGFIGFDWYYGDHNKSMFRIV
jgi:hypothetical protein